MSVTTQKMVENFKIQLDKLNHQNKIVNEFFNRLSEQVDTAVTNYNNNQARIHKKKAERKKKGVLTNLEYSREQNKLHGRDPDCHDFFIIPVGKYRGHHYNYLKSQKEYSLYMLTTSYISKRLRNYLMDFFKFSETQIAEKKYYLEKNPIRRQKLRAELEEEFKRSRAIKED